MRPPSGEVIVVGAVNVDLVVPVERLPGPGETVVGARLARHGGGKGANAAVAAARAGAAVRLVGAIGDDDFGTRALAELEGDGVVIDDVAILAGETTGVALIVVAADGENQIAVAAGANMALDATKVRGAIERNAQGASAVIVSTEVAGPAVVAAVETATGLKLPCILNPAPVVPELLGLLALGPVLTPNAAECIALVAAIVGGRSEGAETGSQPGDYELAEAARLLNERTRAAVVVTRGGAGALMVDAEGQVRSVAPRPTSVVDTTGAGDTFTGVLGTRLGAGDGLFVAVEAATAASSLSVSHAGARDGMPDLTAIEEAMAASTSPSRSRHP